IRSSIANGRFQGEADIDDCVAPTPSVADDPELPSEADFATSFATNSGVADHYPIGISRCQLYTRRLIISLFELRHHRPLLLWRGILHFRGSRAVGCIPVFNLLHDMLAALLSYLHK